MPSTRDRALAELVRLRGWADDASVEKAVAEASGSGGEKDLGSVLLSSGLLTTEQLLELDRAMDGTPSSRGGSGSGADKTVARSGGGATLAGPGKKVGDRVGPYRILRELGRGGMGVVYRALDPELRREVALKVMLSGADSDDVEVERFRREAALVAKLGRHPHLIQIHDIGRDGERLYFTMDFIEGRSVRDRIRDEGPLPAREAARIAAEMAGALAFAHAAGVVHRDVKPHNLMLDRQGKSYLGDFGLARDLSSSKGLTQSGAPIGTPAYMPPEQAEGHASKATAQSDVYSLGATLYEMLTGKPPFDGESAVEIVRRVLDTDPVPPRAIRDGIHRDLEVVCLKAMHKVPARRYATAEDLEGDLLRFLNGDPIHARPIGWAEKLAGRLRRNRAWVAAGAVAFFAAAGFGGLGWKRDRDRREAERLRNARSLADDNALRERRIKANPFLLESTALLDRSAAARQNGDWREAEEYARQAVAVAGKAVEIMPDGDSTHYTLGRALWIADRGDEALAALEECIDINPKNASAWFAHGTVLEDRLRRIRGDIVRVRPTALRTEQGFTPTGLAKSVVFRRTGDEGVPEGLLERATRDFRMATECGLSADRAGFGRAMLFFYEEKLEEALRELDAVLKIDPYFATAIETRAEILEYLTKDMARGLPDREKLCRIQPFNPWYAMDLAFSLTAAGKEAEAREKVTKLAATLDQPELLIQASLVLFSLGDISGSAALSERALAVAQRDEDRRMAIGMIVYGCMGRREFERAFKLLDENEALLGPEVAFCQRGELNMARGDMAAASRAFRRLPTGLVARIQSLSAAYSEWWCGNIDLALPLSETATEVNVFPAARVVRGIARIEAGNLAGALEDFELSRTESPDLNLTYANLAGARFLGGDYVPAMDALEGAMTRTLTNEAQRTAVKKFFEPLKKRAADAKSPAEAAKVVESLAAMLVLALSQATDELTRGAAIEGQRGLLYVLQEFYIRHEMWPEALAAGKRLSKLVTCGNTLYKDAVARARSGKKGSVLTSLEAAIGAGFDDGKRVDVEKSFERFRAEPKFVELRKKCR